MPNFPQKIIDMVIDRLAELLSEDRPDLVIDGLAELLLARRQFRSISTYSTVSRKWVERTQRHHFECIRLGCNDLEKWPAAMKADPSGVLRHVRRLSLYRVKALWGFEEHIRAFTHLESVQVSGCDTTYWFRKVGTFPLMGSNLVRLDIVETLVTPHTMASLLAALPRLFTLSVRNLRVLPDCSPMPPPPTFPFFENANSLELSMWDNFKGNLNWIPPTARFCGLQIDTNVISNNHALVNDWLASSGESLQWLWIRGKSWGKSSGTSLTSLAQHRFQSPPSDCAISF